MCNSSYTMVGLLGRRRGTAMSEILRISSAAYSLVHILLIFMFFYKPRYTVKKTIMVTVGTMGPLLLVNLLMLMFMEQVAYGKIMLFTMVVPSFWFFFLLAKHRDFRFVFTFCLADTVSAEIIILSLIFNEYFTPNTNIVMFAIRILGFPIIEYIIVKKVRKLYFEIQDSVKKGWGIFSLVSIIFYSMVLIMVAWPTMITERPEDMIVMLMIMVLMPVMYINIFQILFHQNQLHNIQREQELWQIQTSHMQNQIHQMAETEERIRLERHNLRHRLQTIDAMLQKKEVEQACEYIRSVQGNLETPDSERYCQNAILDAVFSSYIKRARNKEIQVETSLRISEEIPVDAEALSVVIANALENAIHASERLPQEKRMINCRCIAQPQFMLQISNNFDGNIKLDENGRPLATEDGHGIGTRSILAFCEKNHAVVDYKITENVFALRIVVQNL